ncbi:hypothetical protein PRIPAC_93230 [Pristionchus pacificus]|uniref:Hedgehog receptor n=1 Tax=Pristionchus pacificus TaxID=54126 RepID=A0A2A6BQ64_PRIPA|nr:hypothetical protein PRIPAC_93230 [Pristionchus pacificus]|eukprot:PDM68092.1 Hedgehog receptor [Pristionchus pacificus]
MLAQWIRKGAYHLGNCVARRSSIFVFLPLLIFVGLLQSTIHAIRSSLAPGNSHLNEELFLPDNGRIRQTKERLAQFFPDGGHFSTRSWLAPNLRIVILQAQGDRRTLMDALGLELYASLRSALERAEIPTSRGRVSLASLCANTHTRSHERRHNCKRDALSLVGLLGELQYPHMNVMLGPLDPVNSTLYRRINLSPLLAETSVDVEGNLVEAKMARMVIDLPRVEWITDKEWSSLDRLWLRAIDKFERRHESDLKLFFWSPLQYDADVRSVGKDTAKLVPLLFSALLLFSIITSIRWRHRVQSKPWVAMAGVISPALGISVSIGLLHLAGFVLVPIALLTPFLVLTVGIDDMFIMMSVWAKEREERPEAEGEELMALTYRESSISILLTTLSNVLVYGTGCISTLPAVRLFCLYCTLSMAVVFFFQITFFGSILSIDGKRELEGRNPLTFRKKRKTGTMSKNRSFSSSFSTFSMISDGRMSKFDISKFFISPWCLLPISLTYCIYCIGSGYALLYEVEEGLELSSLLPEGTRSHSYLTIYERYFTGGTPLEVMLPPGTNYASPSARYGILHRLMQLERATPYTADVSCWLVDFSRYVNTVYGVDLPIDNHKFVDLLQREFLQHPLYKDYAKDILIRKGSIIASRLFIPLRGINTTNRIEAEQSLREAAQDDLVLFDVSFGLAEQAAELPWTVISNLFLAGGATVISICILMPTLLNCVLMTWAVLSINAGVFGVLAHLGSRFDVISVITSLLSIGYSLDFSSHILAHFHQLRPSPIGSTLSIIGRPIVNSATSTVLGIICLAPLKGYITVNLVRTIITVCLIGAYHSLLLVPAILQRFL